MAKSSIGTGDASAIKNFERVIAFEALKQTQFSNYLGTVVKDRSELSKSKNGDRVTYQISFNLTAVGRTEGEASENNEEALSKFTDFLDINEIFNAVKLPSPGGSIDDQRVGWDRKAETMKQLAKWHAMNIDISFFNQLAGNTATTMSGTFVDGRSYSGGDLTKALGFNAASAPSANRVVIAGGQANDEDLTSADTMTLQLIDAAVEIAINATPQVEMFQINGEDMYVCFISHEQSNDLRRDTTSAIQWQDIQIGRLSGGDIDENPLLTGNTRGFIYNGVFIVPTTRIPPGVNSSTSVPVTNTKRAILCGKSAISSAFAMSGGAGENGPTAKMFEDIGDIGRELKINAGMIFGMNRDVYNSEDFGTIVISTFAAPHTS